MAALPNPETLKFFDNSNNTPAPYGVNVDFNNEAVDVWIGYDVTTGQICITNFNRTTTLVCFAGLAALNYTVDIVAEPAPGGFLLTATPSAGAAADYTYVWADKSANDVVGEGSATVTPGGAPGNTATVTNAGPSAAARALIRCRVTNIVTGVVKDAYFAVNAAFAAP